MSDNAFYYLHTNGALICKRFRPDPSDFVRRIWGVDRTDRMCAWRILFEATALGADMQRIGELAHKWKCTFADLSNYLQCGGTQEATVERWKGMKKLCMELWGVDVDTAFTLLEESGGWKGWPTIKQVKERMAVAN